MSAPTQMELSVISTIFVVLALAYGLVKFIWNQPLKNGSGFFLGVEVPAGFYEGQGQNWLKGYHATLVALHLVLAVSLGTIIVLGRWDWTPIWAGCTALLYTSTMRGFQVWTRHKLGTRPPVRAAALSLQSRRLGDYISWPMEALFAAMIAISWWLLLRRGAAIDWLPPLQTTWAALILPGKIALVRSGTPLPAERTEEHYRYQDAMRRNGIQMLNAWGWLMVIMLCQFPLRQIWSPAALPSMLWTFLAVFMAVMAYMMIVVWRGMRLTATVGRDLRPAGSWATPFHRATNHLNRFYGIWFALWTGGILVMILYSFFR